MLNDINEINKLISSLNKYFACNGESEVSFLLQNSKPNLTITGYDGLNGGNYYYELMLELEIEDYVKMQSLIDSYSNSISDVLKLFNRSSNEHITKVKIVPAFRQYIDWTNLEGITDKQKVLESIERIKEIMIDVATDTGIQQHDEEYKEIYKTLDAWLNKLKLTNPNNFENLWQWYSRWSQYDLHSYDSRKVFVHGLYKNLFEILKKADEKTMLPPYVETGWDRIDRKVYKMRKDLLSAHDEEDFQKIGLLGRETLISLAQEVYDSTLHKTEDGVQPSEADSKRMLDAYLNYELKGDTNERIRKFAKAAIDLANNVVHDRTASRKEASVCLISVTSVVSIIKVLQDSK
ncbi:MAG: hypothetical protein BWX78_01321 [Firmicutes bacterium ADurb.Bin099]|nr:MAG: hypothetical protein BWX78_01321 [Firmicutes bacterium ADurb.Bin099]